MSVIRNLAVAGTLTLASTSAFAAGFVHGTVNTNANAFLGASLTGAPGVTDTHTASTGAPVGALTASQAQATTMAGDDTIVTTSNSTAGWTNANSGTVQASSNWSLTLPDRGSAAWAEAGTDDRSLNSAQPAWAYQFAATGTDNLFSLTTDVAVTGDINELGAWSVQVFEDGAPNPVAHATLNGGGVTDESFAEALAAGHTYDVEIYSTEQIDLPSTVFSNMSGSSTADFNWTITGPTTTGGVPEPSTWALAIVGFGLTGAALRRRAARRLA